MDIEVEVHHDPDATDATAITKKQPKLCNYKTSFQIASTPVKETESRRKHFIIFLHKPKWIGTKAMANSLAHKPRNHACVD